MNDEEQFYDRDEIVDDEDRLSNKLKIVSEGDHWFDGFGINYYRRETGYCPDIKWVVCVTEGTHTWRNTVEPCWDGVMVFIYKMLIECYGEIEIVQNNQENLL